MMAQPTKSKRCSKLLLEKLRTFGYDRYSKKLDRRLNLMTKSTKGGDEADVELTVARQFLMKHILDCISTLRYIHVEYDESLKCHSTKIIDIIAAENCVFLEAVSLSMKGIFNFSERDERVDLLLNAFPNNDPSFLPLHWAMLAGASVADKTVETIYYDDPLALEEYHQLPIESSTDTCSDGFNSVESWTAGHFLCAAICDGPNMSSRVRKYIKLNSEAFLMKPMNSQTYDTPYYSLHIAAKFCGNTSIIQEIIQLDYSMLDCRSYGRFLCPLGMFLKFNILQKNNWKEITKCFLEADCSLPVLVDAIEGCYRALSDNKIQNTKLLLESEVFVFISALFANYPQLTDYLDEYHSDQTILHHLLEFPCMSNKFCCKLIRLFLRYEKGMIERCDCDGNLPIHIFMENSVKDRFPIFLRLVKAFPESITVTNDDGENVLHQVVGDQLIVRLLCQQCPELLIQKNNYGLIPLHCHLDDLNIHCDLNIIKIMCEINPDICKVAYEDTNNIEELNEDEAEWDDEQIYSKRHDKYLALHFLTNQICKHWEYITDLRFKMIEDVLRLLLRIYPAAANIPVSDGKTPCKMILEALKNHHVIHPILGENKTYFPQAPIILRLLLMTTNPIEDPEILFDLNYKERRMALFLSKRAVSGDGLVMNIWKELWYTNKELLKVVMSFL